MNKIKMTITIIIAVIVVAAVGLRLAVPTLSATSAASGIISSDGLSTLGDCPDTPNCQGSESTQAKQTVSRLDLTKPADDAIDTIVSIVSSQPGTHIVRKDQRYLHATFSTKFMGFTDDVEFLVSDDKQSVQLRSASRIGKSDLGANARRLEWLRSMTDSKI